MKKINISVNPYLELINSVLLTSRYNEITVPFIGYGLMNDAENEYTYAIKSFFAEYKNHKVYQTVENMIQYGFIFSRPVEVALSLADNEDFTVQYTLSPLCIKYCGGIDKIKELIALLKELAVESDYFQFYNKNKAFYNVYIEKANETVNAFNFPDILENEFGEEQNSYNYIISALMKGNFGVHFVNDKTQKADLFSVFTTDSLSMSCGILLHEFSHPFINPLTEKHINLVHKYDDAYDKLAKSRLPDFRSGAGSFPSVP